MLTFIVVLLIVWLLIYVGYVIWDVQTSNRYFDEKVEILKEKDWWIDKFNDCSDDLKKAKDELKKAIATYDDLLKEHENLLSEYEKVKAQYFIDHVKAETLEKEKKLTIAEANKKMIIKLHEEKLDQRSIAAIIGCSRSTIQRAYKKRWLK